MYNDKFVSESIHNFHTFCYLHSNVFACNFVIEENCGHVFTRGGCKYVSPTHTVENVTPMHVNNNISYHSILQNQLYIKIFTQYWW